MTRKLKRVPNNEAIYFIEILMGDGDLAIESPLKHRVSFWVENTYKAKEEINKFLHRKIRQVIIWDSKLYTKDDNLYTGTTVQVTPLAGVNEIIANLQYDFIEKKLVPLSFPGRYVSEKINRRKDILNLIKYLKTIGD